ncbi:MULTISPECIES: bifunctional 3'-5' exonuclease/DNA polymerase [Streptomyces]|uniref:DNA-directed DNA polymerase n=1 Tax=Streptomyces tsukubensis (strain DSM 42081 / NBRC 108919 / NRRL 18488 / 9993) TaxID=1114943 RepID=I2N3G8_STRT9|nr:MULTISPECIES: bifunctional 3'-5' exonuclease/DNA polymerase [Streptomyces]AZK95661.1 bifunctional 3'-5' exonuclease/DNA polymerase [Streptomyces tsukubensis]EIF91565.1 bifunctional 3'-5' exonuclease/DNA polymerase [Streptomyces tsukubensis NRRL18488]MYS68810.1 bifunctional 3'-5' exonuclease/DNA polymerase [Streptomyces sp. SID5473]QKM68308.1 bifunctional 3'-5' exonuclease/DNA polymerase [Streptomyces tsukubensis NRRL18488]TAI43125.1 bifunctional 3'-5' exonuclease/DNA polymerase [Streptomyce
MAERWAIAAAEEGDGARLVPLRPDGLPAGPVVEEPDLVGAVRSRPEVGRWVWRSTFDVYPRLLAAGVPVERCYDIEDAELLLLGHEGRFGEPRSAAAALARLRRQPVPPDPPQRAAEPGAQSSLFEPRPVPVPLESLLEVYAEQQRRHDATAHPGRMRLLTAAESAGMLVASEMNRAGLPWRADVHRRLLEELLGERYAGGGEPRRLAQLADEVSAAFGRRVRPDLPADVVKAFAEAGVRLRSTRRWELEEIDHPAVKPLVEYKKLYRIWVAHGWGWLADWVRDGRFRPGYLPGGSVSGRWTTNGGGALQIPRVIRRAVVADEGWRLVVADADQMEPRVLAAVSRDPGLMEVAGHDGDLYSLLSTRAFAGDREHAKLALLGAIYGQTSGDGLKNLAALRRRFPAAVAYVDDAARAGEEGRLVRTYLGRTCPPVSGAADAEEAGLPQDDEGGAPGSGGSDARARGRFTRNFVVQGAAADWALLMLAALRRATAGLRAELVFFVHDEVVVHCPAEETEAVTEAIREAGALAGRIAFGGTPVRFPFTTAAVECYADAK